ncbi:MAG: beta-phosphoglucomutase family hydrolase [Desulfuromonadales bacterium]|nr:beta-phosphoglucomutase family hydrolase [Desulfuromonadales bacterium]
MMIIDPEKYDAVLFDLDGVLTMTMKIHASCWKRMFDAYFEERSARLGEEFRPFDINSDYKPHVDGKLRYDGVRSLLASRDIHLPEGTPEDGPDLETVCGLGNRKDRMVNEVIDTEGVEVLEGSLAVVRRVHDHGLRTAVVSASKNCEKVLDAAGIRALFDLVVDGKVAARLGLPGKPAPDTFLEAARELSVDPARAVVVEDAISGVQAGRAGGFGLVIGIDHHGDKLALQRNGADIVVEDLSEIL